MENKMTKVKINKVLEAMQDTHNCDSEGYYFIMKQLCWILDREIHQDKDLGDSRNGIKAFADWSKTKLQKAEDREERDGTLVPSEFHARNDKMQSRLHLALDLLSQLQAFRDKLDKERTHKEIDAKDLASSGTLPESHYDGCNNPQSTIQ